MGVHKGREPLLEAFEPDGDIAETVIMLGFSAFMADLQALNPFDELWVGAYILDEIKEIAGAMLNQDLLCDTGQGLGRFGRARGAKTLKVFSGMIA